MSRYSPPQGALLDHEHDGAGAGGDVLDVVQRLGIPVYATDGDAPDGTLFFNSGGSSLKYKTDSGTVVEAGGVENPLTENLDAGGFAIENLGGPNGASAGALRLAQGSAIAARNFADDGDLALDFGATGDQNEDYIAFRGFTYLLAPPPGEGTPSIVGLEADGSLNTDTGIAITGGDQITFITAGSDVFAADSLGDLSLATGTDLTFDGGDAMLAGGNVTQIGGTTDASAGGIRLANATAINWRSSEDDGDFGWRLTAAENMVYAAAGADRASFAENGDLSIEGSLTEGAAL